MRQWGIVAACGPSDSEITRVGDLLESVFHHEPNTRWAAIIDSGDEDRQLARRFSVPSGTTIVGIRNPKSGWAGGQWGPLCVGVLAAYEWFAKETDCDFVAKFDSDALVIAPFAAQIQRAMTEHPDAAIFGSYKFDCNGAPRSINGMAGLMRRLHKLALFEYNPQRFGRRFPIALAGRPATMRRHIDAAVRKGYEFGEHVSGGAYGITGELIRRMHQRGFLAERHCWADSQMSEDVMIGMYARACGLSLAGHAANGDAFGVKHVGLPDTPDRMLERGYSIIHSIKSDTRYTEDQIREYYRTMRVAPGTAVLPESAGVDLAAASSSTTRPQSATKSTAAANGHSHLDDLDEEEVALGF